MNRFYLLIFIISLPACKVSKPGIDGAKRPTWNTRQMYKKGRYGFYTGRRFIYFHDSASIRNR